MDYHNADGSLAEMCGNGIRVFAPVPASTTVSLELAEGESIADRHPRRGSRC